VSILKPIATLSPPVQAAQAGQAGHWALDAFFRQPFSSTIESTTLPAADRKRYM